MKSGTKWKGSGRPFREKVTFMLTGEYNHSIDSKGRLIIPAKFREILGDSFVITKGLDNCLFVYPDNEWKLFEEKLRTLPLTNKNARTFTRFFLGSAVEGVLDKQGRVLISSALRDFAGLEKEVVLVGVLDRVEIWDKAKWDESNAEVEANMDDIAGHMEELGLGI
nr:division/cell wall cluster transcriptional repressor MraZ [Faecalimonas umbilicata]